MLYPYNPNMGQKVQTGIHGAVVDAGYVAHLVWANPVATSANRILNAAATSGAPTIIAAFAGQPDFARQISITPGGTTANALAGNILVEGLDEGGNIITENVAIAAASAAVVFTTKAFKTITKVTIPAQGAAVTFSAGITDKLGIPYTLVHDTALFALFNNVKEVVVLTLNAADATKNLVDFTSALNGSRADLYLVV